MSYLWNAFLAALGQQLRAWKTWLLLLLLPSLIWALTAALPVQERAAPVQVGVALPAQGGDAFWAGLEARSGAAVTFLQAEADTVEAMVAAGQWDCGLLLPDDFQTRLEALDTDRLVTVCISDSSAVYPLVQETVSACLMELLAPRIAQDYAVRSGIGEAFALEEAALQLEQTLPEDSRVHVAMTTLSGRDLDALTLADSTFSNLLQGMTAVVLLIWALLSAVDLGRWLETPAAKRLHGLRSVTQQLLPRAAAAAIPALCAAALAIFLLPDGGKSLPALLAYETALGGLTLLAARWRSLWTALPVLTPLAPVLCLLLSPVLLDCSALFPALRLPSQWMPVTLYLQACQGRQRSLLLLLAAGLGATLLSACLDRRHCRRI